MVPGSHEDRPSLKTGQLTRALQCFLAQLGHAPHMLSLYGPQVGGATTAYQEGVASVDINRGAWAIFPGAQPTEQPRRDPGGG